MIRNVQDLIRQRFGAGASPVTNRALSSVGVTAAQLWPNDPTRIAALLVNLSPNVLYALHQPSVAASRGMRINPSGGSLMLLWDEDFDLTFWEWFVVADAAASPLLTVEWLTGNVPEAG